MSGSLREEFEKENLVSYLDELAIDPMQRQVIQEFCAGKRFAELGEYHGVTPSAVRFTVVNYREKVHSYLEFREKIVPGPALEHISEIGLSPLQQKIILMFAQGQTYKEIVEDIHVEPQTVVRALTAFDRRDYEKYTSERKSDVNLAHKLKELREGAGLTIEQVAEKLDITMRTLIRYEENAKNISMFLVCKLLELYGADLEVIVNI